MIIVLLVVLLGAIVFLFRERISLAAGDYLIIEDKPRPVDVIHVIAGDDYRTEYAIQLYKQGYAKFIFFTGGWCQFHGYYHGLHGQQLALQQGIPPQAILIDDASVTSTYAEAVRLKAWMDQSTPPIRSVMVVSDPFHMRRAQWAYRRALGKEIGIVMAPVPFDQTPYTRRWWMDQSSQRYVRDEYIKSVFYVLRYQLARGRLQSWLATFDVY